VSCSDDKTLKIWDFHEARVEKELEGHGSDVTTVDWHPFRSLIASGGKDHVMKFWDPKSLKKNVATNILDSDGNHTARSVAKGNFFRNSDNPRPGAVLAVFSQTHEHNN
jgi:WD40 repeat protein